MVNKRWLRVISLVLASVCLISIMTAAAAEVTVKKTIWDLQTAVNEGNTASYADILKDILGNPDELHTNASGEYEIWSELGLYNMAKNAGNGYTFKLMKSIDMGGKNWTPISSFKGTFVGNGYTISNLTITQASGTNMGFFGNIQNLAAQDAPQSKVTDLHMKDVTIIVDGDDSDNINTNSSVQYVGAIAGTSSGILENCSSVVYVYDMRQLGDMKKTYYGTLVGLNTEKTVTNEDGSTSKAPMGTISGTNCLDTQINVAEDSAFTQDVITSKFTNAKTVNSKMALFQSEKIDYEMRAKRTAVGIAGFTNSNGIEKTLRWQDITNSTDLAPQALQDRRETAAAYMYELCTVEWQPAQKMYSYSATSSGSWTSENAVMANDKNWSWCSDNHYYEIPQRGLPYALGTASLAQFNDYIGHYTKDSTDLWMPNAYNFNNDAVVTKTNNLWAQYKAADSAAQETLVKSNLVLALIEEQYPASYQQKDAPISKSDQVGWSMYIGSDCIGQVSAVWRRISAVNKNTEGFARVLLTEYMFPTYGTGDSDNNIKNYGVVPVNGLVFEPASENSATARNTVVTNYYKDNKTHYLAALGMVSKADVLVGYSSTDTAHTMLALSDAVVIRKYNGEIDANLSYIVTAEQGGNGTDSDGVNHYKDSYTYTTEHGSCERFNWRSSCAVDRRTTFADLVRSGSGTGISSWTFFPVTCDALRNADSPAGTATISMDAAGTVSSNFNITSTTVNGKTVYTSMVPYIGSGYRGLPSSVKLTDVHGAIEAGTTVTVLLANGKTYTGVFGTAGLTEVG